MCIYINMHACSVASVTSDSATLWIVAHQPSLSMGFSRQEYPSGLPCPPPGDVTSAGIEPVSPVLPADSLLLSHRGSPYININVNINICYINLKFGLPWWLSGKESACRCRRCRFEPWIWKSPWKKKWQPTLVFLPGQSHGQGSLADNI